MTEQSTRTIFVIGDVDTKQLKAEIRVNTNFLVNYNYQDGLKTACWLRKCDWPINAVVIVFRRSGPKEAVSPKDPERFISKIIAEFGNICPILVVSEVGYQRLPFADKGPILCHLDHLAPELAKALR